MGTVSVAVPLWRGGSYGDAMKITHLGHACLLAEYPDARILIDPGSFSDVSGVSVVDAVLITHQHADHLDLDKLRGVLERNSDVPVYADPGSLKVLREAGIDAQENQARRILTDIRQFGRALYPGLPDDMTASLWKQEVFSPMM